MGQNLVSFTFNQTLTKISTIKFGCVFICRSVVLRSPLLHSQLYGSIYWMEFGQIQHSFKTFRKTLLIEFGCVYSIGGAAVLRFPRFQLQLYLNTYGMELDQFHNEIDLDIKTYNPSLDVSFSTGFSTLLCCALQDCIHSYISDFTG